jgi:hypothetical protein
MQFSRRTLMGQFSATALLASCGQGKSGAALPLRMATAAGSFNTTMTALMKQQKFMEQFNVAPETIVSADGSKILAGVVSNSIEIVRDYGLSALQRCRRCWRCSARRATSDR